MTGLAIILIVAVFVVLIACVSLFAEKGRKRGDGTAGGTYFYDGGSGGWGGGGHHGGHHGGHDSGGGWGGGDGGGGGGGGDGGGSC